MSRPVRDTFRNRFAAWIATTWKRVQPEHGTRWWIAFGIATTVLALLCATAQSVLFGFGPTADAVLFTLFLWAVALLAGLLGALVFLMVRDVPRFLGWWGFIILVGGASAAMLLGLSPLRALSIVVPLALIEGAFLASWRQVLTRRWFTMNRTPFYFTLVVLLLTTYANVFLYGWFTTDGTTDHLTPIPKVDEATLPAPSRLPDPTAPGIYEVASLTYGSGNDGRRPEYAESVAIVTDPVDATDFVSRNSWWKQPFRDWFWGFGLDALPRNGRVWYPQGDGPYPLVLIVHGNHLMEDFSDGGYEYLGRHLASRGYIVASIDENFLNYNWTGNLKVENDCRGWMLLKHLELWRAWNEEEGNPFAGKVDLERIGLIGHSRGGEAVAIAAAFNRLSAYPDDATIAFDFNFNIRSVIAIAPVDGQYKASKQPTPLKDVDYLVVHGGHDGDVTQFVGDRQYDRVEFSGDAYHFKSAVYIYRANHGQFNASWGREDATWPYSLTLNLAPLLPEAEQQRIALGLFTTFFEGSMDRDPQAVAVFRDLRTAREWLPEDIYIGQFQDSTFVTVADFDEDIDPGTATVEDGTVSATGLAAWKEDEIPLRKSGTKANKAAYVAWTAGDHEETPVFTVTMPSTTAVRANRGQGVLLTFSVTQHDGDIPDTKSDVEPKDRRPSFAVEVRDSHGASVTMPIARYGAVPPILIGKMTRMWNESSRVGKEWEPVLQTFEIPLDDLGRANRALDIASITEIQFRFDTASDGYLILDNIGFTSRVEE